MSLFQEATDLNNNGIKFLLLGDQDTAIDLMGKAIKLMRTDLATHDILTWDNEHGSSSPTTQSVETIEIKSTDSLDAAIFNEAIRIPAGIDLSAFEKNVFTSATVYNYALAHQMRASTGNAEDLNKAEKLYCLVVKMLSYSALNAHAALIVNLACINNLTQIRYEKGDFKNAREGFKQVARFVRASANQAMFNVPEIQALLMSVLLLKAPTVANAA